MAYSSSFLSSKPFGGFQRLTPEHHRALSTREAVPAKPAPLDLPALQAASRVLQDQLIKDAQIVPDLGDMLTIPGAQSSASYTIFPGDHRVPFQKRKHVGIPPALWEHFQSSKFVCHMGILPEIERGWITMDHKLFLWDYTEGQDLSSFAEQPEIITHVALVKPKPGVFIDDISSLLVICTPISVLLLGVSSKLAPGPDGRLRKEIALYATDMNVSTDGIEMVSVAGTDDGRIFMCGSGDGGLYELHYQEKEVWFGKRFHLINHSASGISGYLPRLRTPHNEERIACLVADQSRGCFYTLSEQNWISIWKPEANKSVRKIQTLSNLQKQALDKAPGAPALSPNFRLLSLHVIEQRESKSGVQLMALSDTGVRLYFSPSLAGYGYGFGSYGSASDPKQLQLVHVRLPPANLFHPDEQYHQHLHRAQTGAFGQPSIPQPPDSRSCVVNGLSTAAYVNGLLVTSQSSDVDGKDFVLGVSPDLTRIASLGQAQIPHSNPQAGVGASYGAVGSYSGISGQPRVPLTEQATMLYVEGRVWAIAASTPESSSSQPAIPAASPAPIATNELATQFSQPHQEFVIVTNAGISFLVKRKALDFLKDAIEEVQAEGNVQPLIDFRDSFGRDQTCAMLLALASGNTFTSPGKSSLNGLDVVMMVSPELVAVTKQAFYDLGEKPIWLDRGYTSADGQEKVLFSGRREGLALYLARLLRPVWRAKLTKPGAAGLQESNVHDGVLVTIQKNLYALKEFLDKNAQLFNLSPGDHVAQRDGNDRDAWKVEQTSAMHLQALLARTIEAISFVLLLIDYKIGEILAQCTPDVQRVVSSLTYEELITTQNGLNVSRTLVNVIINRQIGQAISIDTISEVLQQRCGSFCSADDVMLYKARENVRKAIELHDPRQRQAMLGESLRLFTRACRIIEFEKLREICGDYQQLRYAKGAVDLPLQCARAADSDNAGLEYWMAGCPAGDPRSELLERRLSCYDLILDSLSVFDEQSAKMQDADNEAEGIRDFAYSTAFSSEDPVFHSHLYDWLIDRGMADALLEIRPGYLESHLQRPPITVTNYRLLWQLYVKNGQFLRAAEVLAALAQSTDFDLPLNTRLEFLTLAVSNAKSHPTSVAGKHETVVAFLTELEDQLEVAQVQLEVYNALSSRINEPGEVGEKVKLLQKGLMSVTELYQLYAEPFDLPEVKLLILHVSAHRDEGLVKSIWNTIFDNATDDVESDLAADRIASVVVSNGRRFYPSESAFPLRHVSSLLVRFSLSHKDLRAYGWAPRLLRDCGVPYSEIWDIFHTMYESQVPPFNEQENTQAISSDIAELLRDWVGEALRPGSSSSGGDFPVDQVDREVTKYIEELGAQRIETRNTYDEVRRQLRRYW